MRKKLYLFHLSVLLVCLHTLPAYPQINSSVAPKLIVRYPYNEAGGMMYESRTLYFVRLLHLALGNSGQPFELRPIDVVATTSSRNTRNLENGLYDINWLHTTTEREQQLLPVRIPLYKGLIGWRLLMTHKDFQDRLETIASINELRMLRFGLGHDWPDTFVLRENGFQVATSVNRQSMYKMLRRERTHVVTRSVLEVWDEREEYHLNDVVLESCLVLQYPSALYFFLNKDNAKLAQIIERGLEAAIKDGSFDALFWETYGETVRRANLDKRKILLLPNPLIPKETPVDRKELWFSLDDLKKYKD